MQLFWEQGYEATSVQDLVDHLCLNRSSLYNTFGGKHDLFLEALDQYRAEDLRILRRRLSEAPTALEGIRQAFAAVSERAIESQCGCFTANATMERAPHDPSTQERTCEAFQKMRSLFQGAVEQGQEEGDIPQTRSAKGVGRYLTNALNGIHLTAKTSPSPDIVKDIVEETLRGIQTSEDVEITGS